jgi:DNA uptake protein ComE-like DNA-binding protein
MGEHKMQRNLPVSLFLTVLALLMAGCTTSQQNPQELKEKTAETTAALKRDAKAVAAGVREGWSRDKPLDLNHSSKDELASLPGITSTEADRIINNRPYDDPSQLVTRHVVSKSQYDRISDRVTTKR